jgi:sigma-B regulation protein RsbU (phosphoserine phosphatase)
MKKVAKPNRASEKLQLSKIKLDSLLKVTIGINENLSTNELLSLFLSILYNDLRIGKICLFVKREQWELKLNQGVSESALNIDWEKVEEEIQGIHVVSSSDLEFLHPFDVIIPIRHKSKPLAYLLLGDFDGEKLEVSPIIKHLHYIQTLSNIIVVAFENKRLYQNSIKNAALQKELDVARDMQRLLIPNNLPSNQYYQFNSLYLPFEEVGGDYFDVIQLEEDRIAFCIADVSGKGVSAALLMANFQANLRALVNVAGSLEELIVKLNQKVIESGGREKFITFFIGIYNPKTRTLNTVNAGHNPPLLFQNNEVVELNKGCTILGMFDELPEILVEQYQLEINAKILCYTDGITEITNDKNEEFGIEPLRNVLVENKVKNISDELKKSADLFRGNRQLPDDITLLAAIFQ